MPENSIVTQDPLLFVKPMPKPYLNHPLLRNPLKWLRKPKYLASESYTTTFYNTESLKHNPYAHLLAKGTAMNAGSRDKYAKASLVRLTVDSSVRPGPQNTNPKPKSKPTSPTYFMVPAINSPSPDQPVSTIFPKSYILNSWLYFRYCDIRNNWRRFVPLAFKTKNNPSILAHLGELPGISNAVPSIYVKNILKGCSSASGIGSLETGEGKVDGLWISFTSEAEDPGKEIRLSESNIPSSMLVAVREALGAVDQPKAFVPYRKENVDLLKNIVLLRQYYSYHNTHTPAD